MRLFGIEMYVRKRREGLIPWVIHSLFEVQVESRAMRDDTDKFPKVFCGNLKSKLGIRVRRPNSDVLCCRGHAERFAK